MKLQKFRSNVLQVLDEWLALVFGCAVGAYLLWGCLLSILAGVFVYHTRLNLGYPVPISWESAPVTFTGLVIVQIGFAVLLIHGSAWWGLRHILRRRYPRLNWGPRDSHKMPGWVVVAVGAVLVAVGLIVQRLQLISGGAV